MAKKKTTNKNVNKNVNKNNINITINPSKKRTYKKRSTGNPLQPKGYTVFNPTIINQIPNTQNTKPADDLKKMAYEYNIPRNPPKPSDTAVVEKPSDRMVFYNDNTVDSVSQFSDYTAHSSPVFNDHIPPNKADNKMNKMTKSTMEKAKPIYQPYPKEYYATYFESQIPTTTYDYDDSIPDLIPFVDTQQPFNALKKNRIENKINRVNENNLMRQEDNRAKKDLNNNYELLTETEIFTNPIDKNIAILRKPKEGTFQSQVPSTQGFITPEKRRDTIIPKYQAPSTQDVLTTPDIMDRILKRTRRKNSEMNEAKAMGEEDKFIMGKVPARPKSKDFEERQKALKQRGDKLIQSLQKTRDLAYNINI